MWINILNLVNEENKQSKNKENKAQWNKEIKNFLYLINISQIKKGKFSYIKKFFKNNRRKEDII